MHYNYFLSAAFALCASQVSAESIKATLKTDQGKNTINREIYGQFAEHLGSCIYGGLWVGENSPIPNINGYRKDVFEALKDLNVPVLRWPGGCFADDYHWMDGIGPRDKRPSLRNNTWGGTIEDNSFGTHEFLNLCEMLGCEPYVSGNVGSGTVKEMAQWVEYMTSNEDTPMARLRRQNGRDKAWHVKYFGIGNEAWGCGGNMTPEYYSDEFRKFNTYLRDQPGNHLYRIGSGASDSDYKWTSVLMDRIGERMNGVSLHYYTAAGWNGSKGSAIKFDNDQYYWALGKCLEIEEVIKKHKAIMDEKDPNHRVDLVVDEWGTWWDDHRRPPLSAECPARRFCGFSLPRRFPSSYRPCEDGEYRTGCQRTAIHDSYRPRRHRPHGTHPNLLCFQDVRSFPGCHLSAHDNSLRHHEGAPRVFHPYGCSEG